MKTKQLFLFLMLTLTGISWGQVDITPIRTDVSGFTSWSDTSVAGTTYLQLITSTSKTITPAMNFNDYTNETLDFKARTFGGGNATQSTITVSISIDNGSNWTVLGTRVPSSSTLTSQTQFDLSSYSGTQVKIKFESLGASSSKGFGIDDISIRGIYSILSPPALTPDTSLNTVDNNLDITFTDDATWRGAITAVKIGATQLTATTDYEITAGNLQLKPSGLNALLTANGSKNVVIEATGYSNATVTQVINVGVPTVANSTVTINAPLALNTTRTVTCTAKDQYNNLVSGYNFAYNATATTIDATTSESYTVDGDVVTATLNDYLANTTNASGVATFSIVVPATVDYNDGVSVQVKMEDGSTNLGSPFSFIQNKTPQTITFGALSSVTYGDAPFSLTASASSGLSVTYSSSNTAVATVSGNTVTIVGTGTTNITASQAGNGSYYAAPDVVQALTVNTKVLTVDTPMANNKVYDGTTTATFSGTLNGIVGADVVTLNGTGTFADANVGTSIAVTSTATLGGANASKYTLTQPTGLLADITKANQTITMASTLTKYLGNADFSPATSATSGINPITYASSDTNVATIVSGQVHIVAVGSTTITASQAGSTNYNAATDATMTLTVSEDTQTYRSKANGNWNVTTTWESSADGLTGWANATSTPNENNTVYIQSGHTVTLTQNESCKDLHIASGTTSSVSSGYGKIALDTYTLNLFGKIRCYYASIGTLPGTNQNNGYQNYPFTATTGKVSVVGSSRNLTTVSEWSANITNAGTGIFPLEINIASDQTITLGTSIKATSISIISGTLDAGINTISCYKGSAGLGDVTVGTGATLITSAATANVFQGTGSNRAGTLTVDGKIVFKGSTPKIGMNAVIFNGEVEYSGTVDQAFAVAVISGASPTIFNNLTIKNSGIKTMSASTTVNGTLTIENGSTLSNGGSNQVLGSGNIIVDGTFVTQDADGFVGATAAVNGPTVTLNAGSTVEYAGTTQAVTVSPNYKNLKISAAGTKTITDNVTVEEDLTVSAGVLNVNSEKILTVLDQVQNTGGAITFANSASLMQNSATTTNSNTGNITYNRTSATMVANDYAYWSSPVAGEYLDVLTNTDKVYSFTQSTQAWNHLNLSALSNTVPMVAGVGYIGRMIANGTQTAAFEGVPNNGDVTITGITSSGAEKYMLLGNPYPSAIDLELLQDDNAAVLGQTFYFWKHTTPYANGEYSANDYATYSVELGAGTGGAGGTNPGTRYVSAGQGFFADLNSAGMSSATLTFKNSHRVGDNNTNFFRSAATQTTTQNTSAAKIWFNFKNDNAFKQTLLAYTPNAINGFDPVDATTFDGQPHVDFYTLAETKKLVIQARAPFVNTDVVPMGYRVSNAGTYTIEIDHLDNVWNTQNIYLNDKQLNVVHDIKANPYSFTTPAGVFDTRFEIIYQTNALSNPDVSFDKAVIVFAKDKNIHINSGLETIKDVVVYDLQGRIITTKTNINATQIVLENLKAQTQVLLVKVTSTEGKITTKKVVF